MFGLKKEEVRKMVQEMIDEAIESFEKRLEKRLELAKIEHQVGLINSLKYEVESTKAFLCDMRAAVIDAARVSPEMIVCETERFKELIRVCISDAIVARNIPREKSHTFRTVYWLPELITEPDHQHLDPKYPHYLVIGGLKNRGCTGRYVVQIHSEDWASFYIRESDSFVTFPAFALAPQSAFFIRGDHPNFELIGAQII
jgi:hypothetical protein